MRANDASSGEAAERDPAGATPRVRDDRHLRMQVLQVFPARRSDPLSGNVALAWQALGRDPSGVKLVERVAADGDGIDVIADYFRDHGIALIPLQIVALARSYRDAGS